MMNCSNNQIANLFKMIAYSYPKNEKLQTDRARKDVLQDIAAMCRLTSKPGTKMENLSIRELLLRLGQLIEDCEQSKCVDAFKNEILLWDWLNAKDSEGKFFTFQVTEIAYDGEWIVRGVTEDNEEIKGVDAKDCRPALLDADAEIIHIGDTLYGTNGSRVTIVVEDFDYDNGPFSLVGHSTVFRKKTLRYDPAMFSHRSGDSWDLLEKDAQMNFVEYCDAYNLDTSNPCVQSTHLVTRAKKLSAKENK